MTEPGSTCSCPSNGGCCSHHRGLGVLFMSHRHAAILIHQMNDFPLPDDAQINPETDLRLHKRINPALAVVISFLYGSVLLQLGFQPVYSCTKQQSGRQVVRHRERCVMLFRLLTSNPGMGETITTTWHMLIPIVHVCVT